VVLKDRRDYCSRPQNLLVGPRRLIEQFQESGRGNFAVNCKYPASAGAHCGALLAVESRPPSLQLTANLPNHVCVSAASCSRCKRCCS
jgi:hypothetical protein